MITLSLYYTDKPGGFCKRLYRLFRALAARSHTVHYLSLDPPPADAAAAVVFHRIPFWTTRRSGLLFWASFVLWCPIVTAWHAIRLRPERIIVFGAFYSTMSAPAAFFTGAPIVLFLRSLVFEIDRITGKPRWLRYFTEAVERFGMRRASKIVCMSASMAAGARSFAGARLAPITILPNDLPPSPGARADIRALLPSPFAYVALTSGVLDQRKNVAVLLEAWRQAPPAWALVIAGSGPLLEALGAKSRALGLSNVIFLGWVANLADYMSSVQLVLHPSLHEGVSNSILEGIAAGVPVLASDIPEHRELLPDPALLVAQARWKDRLEPALSDSAELLRLKEAAVKISETLRFDWEERAVELACS